MAEEENNNSQDIIEEKPVSEFEKKIKDLLNELDNHLEQIGGDYGPILMDELQNRLEKVVKNFNSEVNDLFTKSFDKWKVADTQLRELIKSDVKIPDNNKSSKKTKKKSNSPKFIKDIKFGPVRPK